MNNEFYKKVEKYMLSVPKDSCHDEHHSYRVLYSALEIAKDINETIDYDVLIISSILHDIARIDQINDPSICHAEHGAELAYKFLIKSKFDEEKSKHVRKCIYTHRYRKSNPPTSIEAKILFDADKLDALGSIGMARALNYTGFVNRPFYTLDKDNMVLENSNSENTFVDEYNYKLLNIYDRLYTESAKKIAEIRLENQTNYYNSFIRELNDLYKNKNIINSILEN